MSTTVTITLTEGQEEYLRHEYAKGNLYVYNPNVICALVRDALPEPMPDPERPVTPGDLAYLGATNDRPVRATAVGERHTMFMDDEYSTESYVYTDTYITGRTAADKDGLNR